MVVGLVVGILVKYVFPGAKGSGVNQTKSALYIYDGYISFRTVIGKFITAALAIGSGHSLGPEDPSLQIGAGVASLFSRRMRLSRRQLRVFAPVGAAAGLGAAFNAPISAIVFVIEEVIGNWNASVLMSIVLATMSSVAVARYFLGTDAMFRIPYVDLRDPRELIAYAVLGVAGGFAGIAFSGWLLLLRRWSRRAPSQTAIAQPAVAGLLVGLIGYIGLPQVMGPGYSSIDAAIQGDFALKTLLLLAVFKMIATTLSFSSGTPGGMFAPTLFVGAMLGAAVGDAEHLLFPHFTGPLGSYALIGMGVLFAALLRAPLTSVFMVLEISGNYSIVLPVILANSLAYLIARKLQPVPVFEALTHEDGLDLPSMEMQREAVPLAIEDAMQPVAVPVLEAAESPVDIQQALAEKAANVALLRRADRRWYAISADEVSHQLEGEGSTAAIEPFLGSEKCPVLYGDMPLESALHYLHRWPLLPISNRANATKVDGVLTLNAALACYGLDQKPHSR
jgi:CIC family chloride channel protein